ncbi:peptide ABC transporter substrate-binding protein [Planctomycetales bacterium ZRK34]|nr:peptide ABC transporter substrate-binding protein [Planctomycetales bacterium ZRK34]
MRLLLPVLILVGLMIGSLMLNRPEPRAELTTGYISVETLDPQIARASEDIRIAYALFEGLYSFDNEFNTVPGVASSYDLSDDHRTWTFHLRASARWSDGEPVTASDFTRSWMIGLLPDTSPPYIEFLQYIRGGADFTKWATERLKQVNAIVDLAERRAAAQQRVDDMPAQFHNIVGVRTPDDHTIVVELERPVPYFLEIAASWPLFPLPMHVIDKLMQVDPGTGMLRRDPQWIKPDNDPPTMISNGPFELAAWKFKRAIRMQANPHYWNADAVGPESVELRNYSDMYAMYNAYHSGGIDIALGVTPVPFAPEIVEAQRAGKRDDVHQFNAYGTYYYACNTRPTLSDGRPNPLANVHARRALAMAIDRQLIVDSVTRLHQQATTGFTPTGAIRGYDTPTGLEYNLEAARAEMRAAGYGPGKPFGPLLMIYNTGGGHDLVAQAMARMWEQAFAEFGLEPQTEAQEWKVFIKRRSAGNFMVARGGWFGDYTDPTTFLDLFKTGNGNNDSGFSDPKYDAMLAEAAETLDPVQRFDLLEKAEAYIVRDRLPIVPLYYYSIIDLYDAEHVSNVSTHPRNLQMFARMKVHPK